MGGFGGYDGEMLETGGAVIVRSSGGDSGPTGFHAHYPEIALEIGFVERMVDRVREGGGGCVVQIGRLGDSVLIARSLLAVH